MPVAETLRLAGAALGTVGGVLLFVELFLTPSYVVYQKEFDSYEVQVSPAEIREYTWFGRAGALAVAVGFALIFVATLVG